jgi:hypothetical protein
MSSKEGWQQVLATARGSEPAALGKHGRRSIDVAASVGLDRHIQKVVPHSGFFTFSPGRIGIATGRTEPAASNLRSGWAPQQN